MLKETCFNQHVEQCVLLESVECNTLKAVEQNREPLYSVQHVEQTHKRLLWQKVRISLSIQWLVIEKWLTLGLLRKLLSLSACMSSTPACTTPNTKTIITGTSGAKLFLSLLRQWDVKVIHVATLYM